jgi:nicotinamidase-related amidase
MEIEKRTASNTTIVLIDYVTGFANLIGSQSVERNIAGGRALAQTALTFGVPLIVTMGPKDDPRGVLYPEIATIVGDHPVTHRGLSFDAFEDEGFERAVADTQARHLVIAGLMTDGCVMHTTLSALRRDYSVSLVVDASACESEAAQNAAILRLSSYGVVPRSWLSLAAELQRSYEFTETLEGFRAIQANMPGYRMLNATIGNLRK